MGLYFISNNKEQSVKAQKELEHLFRETADIYNINNLYMVVTKAYRKSYTFKFYGKSKVFIMGTIFNDSGFNENILDLYEDEEKFVDDLKDKRHNFWGHYIVIILREGIGIEIIPDKIGLLNTYYTHGNARSVYVSNDMLLLSFLSGNNDLHWQSLYEFLLTESNVGKNTIFSGIYRLKLGNELLISERGIEERKLYNYCIEKMEKNQYLKRIEHYFNGFNNYKKRIAVDLSAGYDTRLVFSVANKIINNLEAVTVKNQRDHGVDVEISNAIAKKTRIKLHMLNMKDEPDVSKNVELVLHGTSGLRDAKRSCKFPILLKKKYKVCDLALGGYGGEVLRAKYQKYENIREYVNNYLKANEAEKICKFKNYYANILNELNEYPIPDDIDEQTYAQNWYYAVSKMRIWGSGFVQMSSLYGDVIHPFMDWYLLNPLFGFDIAQLEGAKFQEELIELFSPGLMDIPVNRHIREKVTFKERIVEYCKGHKFIRNNVPLLFCFLRNVREYSRDWDGICPADCRRRIQKIMSKYGRQIRSRMKAVLAIYEYSKTGKVS